MTPLDNAIRSLIIRMRERATPGNVMGVMVRKTLFPVASITDRLRAMEIAGEIRRTESGNYVIIR